MALFESYERREKQILAKLAELWNQLPSKKLQKITKACWS